MLGEREIALNSDLMDYMGYRNMILEEKIEECVTAAQHGESEVTFDREDLTDEEAEYIIQEEHRRLGYL